MVGNYRYSSFTSEKEFTFTSEKLRGTIRLQLIGDLEGPNAGDAQAVRVRAFYPANNWDPSSTTIFPFLLEMGRGATSARNDGPGDETVFADRTNGHFHIIDQLVAKGYMTAEQKTEALAALQFEKRPPEAGDQAIRAI